MESGVEWSGAERDLMWRLEWHRHEPNQVEWRVEWRLEWRVEWGLEWRLEWRLEWNGAERSGI